MHSTHEIVIFEENQTLPPYIEQQVKLLFNEHYYSYHYMDELSSNSRVKIIARKNDVVTGYATYLPLQDFAYLSNLLVHKDCRGQGVGRLLENGRFEHAKSKNRYVYVSCTCDDTFSQRLKISLGLYPLCIKYGYRESVSYQGHIGSAMIFSDYLPLVESPITTKIQISHDLKRVSLLLKNPLDETVLSMDEFSDYYIEVLVGQEWKGKFLQDSRFTYGGIDMFRETGTWHYMFQLKNHKFELGRASDPQLIVKDVKMLCLRQKEC